MTSAPLVLSVSEACSALRIGKTTLYTLINSNKLTAVKIGRGTRITSASVRGLIEEASGGAA